jgi:regulatory protein
LFRRFERDEVPEEVIEEVIGRLREQGLVDDRAFAEAWVENRQAFRPRSARALRYELRKKGVEREHIEAALQGFSDEAAAIKAADKAARRYQHLSEKLFRRRLAGYLARRGFRYGTVSPIVDQKWDEVRDDGDESED